MTPKKIPPGGKAGQDTYQAREGIRASQYTNPNSFPGLVGFLACLGAGWVFLNPLVSFPFFPGLVGERMEDSRHFSVQVP